VHGQEQDAGTLAGAIRSIGRFPRQRTTLYQNPVRTATSAQRLSATG
jgi:2-iminoacetate synthase ThiH